MRLVSSLLLFFIGIPLLFGMIWGAGAGKAVTHPNFLGKVPQKIIAAVPDVLDKALQAAHQSKKPKNPNAVRWLKAIRKSNETPSSVLKQLQLEQWLKKEVASAVGRFGKAMRGTPLKSDITLDLRPLKKALASPAFAKITLKVLAELPTCNEYGTRAWVRAGVKIKLARQTRNKDVDIELPPCNPGAVPAKLLMGEMFVVATDIPDNVVVLRAQDAPVVLHALRLANSMFWFLFLVPLFLIVVFSAIAGTGWRGFFQRSGWTALLAGGIGWFSSKMLGEVSNAILQLDPRSWNLQVKSQFWTDEANRLFLKKMAAIAHEIINPIVASVGSVAVTVLIVGGVLMFLSLFTSTPSKTETVVVKRRRRRH